MTNELPDMVGSPMFGILSKTAGVAKAPTVIRTAILIRPARTTASSLPANIGIEEAEVTSISTTRVSFSSKTFD